MLEASPQIRLATTDDVGAINEIYNYYVATSLCTFHLEPITHAERLAWLQAHGPRHPVTVIQGKGDGKVLGWASLSTFRERPAYAATVETSVYIHHEHHGKGLGRALLVDLVTRARELGHHTMLGGMEASQVASMRLHESLGFVRVAEFQGVGFKFGEWRDTVFYQLML